MQVVVDSRLTSYEIVGKGKLILLLHGWGDRAAGLHGLQLALSKDFCVIALDLPGFGGTEAPSSIWGLDEYATFVEHFLQKIKANPVHVVVGHSNGGAIAIRGLANGSLHAERLVLIAAAGIRGEQKTRLKALQLVTKVGKVVTAPLPASAKRTLRRKVYDTAGSDMLVAGHLQETFKRVVADDVRADTAKLTMPTLLIYGDRDTATPVWFGERYHELIAHSTLTIVPGVGHFIHLERLVEVTKAITEFAR